MNTSVTSIGSFAIYKSELSDFVYSGMENILPGMYTVESDEFAQIFGDRYTDISVINNAQTIRDVFTQSKLDLSDFELGYKVKVIYYDDEICVRFHTLGKTSNALEHIYEKMCIEIDNGVYRINYGDDTCAVLSADEYSELIDQELISSQTQIIEICGFDVLEQIIADDLSSDAITQPDNVPQGLEDLPNCAIMSNNDARITYNYDASEA